ncbi:MAG: histidinol-phosphatase HisJ family protein [Chitinivibrionales bacterium]|nr:histidinol-phosphatase HisJ family protein [Chitinivibrionales bacterium]
MKLTFDTHLHSDISCDSKVPIDQMCATAVDKGLSHLCFTEHIDMNKNDKGYNFYDYERYCQCIDRARQKYAGKLTVLKGLEFGEPHLYPSEFERMMKLDFDFVLGSIHWLADQWVGQEKMQKNHTLEQLYEIHYEQTLLAVNFGGFDSLAHIDFPKRYLPQAYEPVGLIDEILKNLIKKGIALELNSSPLRKKCNDIFPSDTIVAKYIHHGGRNVTIGSDAHRVEEIGMDFDAVAEKIRRFGLSPVLFVQRGKTAIV